MSTKIDNHRNFEVLHGLHQYSQIPDSSSELREYSITLGLQEGYKNDADIQSMRDISDAARNWMQERAARRQPFLSGIIQQGDILYAHPTKTPPFGSSGEEPVLEFKGMISPLYNKDLSNEEVEELINELATVLGNAARQTRVYVSFLDKSWVLQQDGKTTPREDHFTAATLPGYSLYDIGQHLITCSNLQIDLINSKTVHTAPELRSKFRDGRLYVCDFYVEDIEQNDEILGGFYSPEYNIVNIDHHAPHDSMYRYISSGNLAAEYVKYGSTRETDRVIINHTDCDSVLSSLIMRGHIPPLPCFEEAVIAADHTGQENEIADLLQALDVRKNLTFSVVNLGFYLTNRPLTLGAQYLLDQRMQGRADTADAIKTGNAVIHDGEVALVHITGNMRNEFMPALLPDAAVIMTYEEMPNKDNWTCRLRLGRNTPQGFTLKSLNMAENIDPKFGGRWNAGSNKRGGGTDMPVQEYYKRVYDEYLWSTGRT